MKRRRCGFLLLPLAAGCSADGALDLPSGSGATGGSTAAGGAGGLFVSGGTAGAVDFNIPDPLPAGGAASQGGTGPAPGPVPRFDRDDCRAPSDAALVGGSGSTASGRLLYPYDGTVFPRGLLPVILQWEGPAATRAMVIIQSKHVDYRGCFDLVEPGRLEIPPDVWDAVADANEGVGDPAAVSLTTTDGGSVTGPLGQTWHFAAAKLKGSIYYNTYNSPLAAAQGIIGGVVLRLFAGAPAPEVFLRATNPDQCVGCHAVSANGTRMALEVHTGFGLGYGTSASFAIGPSTPPNPPPLAIDIPQAGFAGFYPDGSRFVTTARPGAGGPWSVGNIIGTYGPGDAVLYDTDSGQALAGSGVTAMAMMPMFSPGGTRLVFTDATLGGDGKGLAMQTYDRVADRLTDYEAIFSHPSQYPGWAFFLPDESGVVFALGTNANYSGEFAVAPISDVYWLDLRDPGRPVSVLASAMGYTDATMSGTYLGRGDLDLRRNFFPTGSPVAAGGYFWLFFTSRRAYGNIKAGDPALADSKQIWVAALDIGGTGDISHPAFHLRGQELAAGNVRAFTALEPCRADGAACETGVDCCSRSCLAGTCGQPPVERCGEIDEGCDADADCCPAQRGTVECIARFCEVPAPPIR